MNGNKQFARYANMPPGHYVFRVKAANNDGVWNETPAELFITISPPFWRTSWFYTVCGFLVALILFALFYLFTVRQKRKMRRELDVQRKLEHERIRISRDLHDNVGAQLSYLITNMKVKSWLSGSRALVIRGVRLSLHSVRRSGL
jgi:hypothetical protein